MFVLRASLNNKAKQLPAQYWIDQIPENKKNSGQYLRPHSSAYPDEHHNKYTIGTFMPGLLNQKKRSAGNSWGYARVSMNGCTAKSSIYRWMFRYKPSSYWGTPIFLETSVSYVHICHLAFAGKKNRWLGPQKSSNTNLWTSLKHP